MNMIFGLHNWIRREWNIKYEKHRENVFTFAEIKLTSMQANYEVADRRKKKPKPDESSIKTINAQKKTAGLLLVVKSILQM